MNAKEFVACWKKEKEDFLKSYLDKSVKLHVNERIMALNLNAEQEIILQDIVDGILTDVFYTLLLGLDGEANIGGIQATYRIYDEEGNLLSECGEIEAEAYKQFHKERNKG